MRYMARRAGRAWWVVPVVALVAVVLGGVAGVLWGGRGAGHQGALPGPTPPTLAPAQPGRSRLVLTQDQLTDRLRQAAGTASPDAQVTCRPGLLVVTGTYHQGPLAVPLTVTIVPYIENGAIAVRVQEAKVAGAHLPAAISMQLANRMKHVLYEQQHKVPGLVLDTVEVRDKELELTGHFASGAPPPSPLPLQGRGS